MSHRSHHLIDVSYQTGTDQTDRECSVRSPIACTKMTGSVRSGHLQHAQGQGVFGRVTHNMHARDVSGQVTHSIRTQEVAGQFTHSVHAQGVAGVVTHSMHAQGVSGQVTHSMHAQGVPGRVTHKDCLSPEVMGSC